ncbi:MAG: MerR family transcriptional regulator [Thermodesulfobacteriota bacterium]
MNSSDKKPVSIGEAARATGVTVKQIRHWHEQGYIPAPERIVCGERSYRYFNDNDLKIISRIKAYLDQGYTVKTAAEKTKNDFSL